MRKTGIINPHLAAAIAGVGHTQTVVIADAGLPLPKCANIIDLSLTLGTPTFAEVLQAVVNELAVESYVYAEEMEAENIEEFTKMQDIIGKMENCKVAHEKLKEMLGDAYVLIRTGECSKYCNVILVASAGF